MDKSELARLLEANRKKTSATEFDVKLLQGPKGDKGDPGRDGVSIKGDRGEQGLPPKHLISEGKIKFENPDGTWGKWIDFNELVDEAVGKATEGDGFVGGGTTGEASPAEAGGPVAWGDITGKPTTVSGYAISDVYTTTQTDVLLATKSSTSHNHDGVYAAVSHSHAISDVTGLQGSLDSKADATATQSALDGKAALSHTHTASQITDFSEAVDDRVSALLVAGSNVTLTYNDASNTLTVASTGGGGGGVGVMCVPWLSTGTATTTLTNHPNSEQSLANTPDNSRKLVPLTGFTQARIVARQTVASGSANDPRIYAKYAATYGGTYNDLASGTNPTLSLSSIGSLDTGWFDIAEGAKGDVYVDIKQNGGDGAADPALVQLAMYFK